MTDTATDTTAAAEMTAADDSNEQIAVRRKKLGEWRASGQAYPNDFKPTHQAADCHAAHGETTSEALEAAGVRVVVAGRMMTRRVMGKASFCTIKDVSGTIQLYVQRDSLPEGLYADFKHWDLGDIMGAEGVLFKTKTGELSVKVDALKLLVKALRPLPDKYHGLTDQEQRFRQRYVDLIANDASRRLFLLRSKLVASVRRFLEAEQFMEVETPMLHAQAGGAAARPFTTHHNAMDMELCLRIAPELYLKRLVVGGFERVFELNRNFRNEGISTRHNPEFTMLEFYQAYANYNDLMDLTEKLFLTIAQDLYGHAVITHQGVEIDMSKPFARMTVVEAILQYSDGVTADQLNDLAAAKQLATQCGIRLADAAGLGKIQMELFEHFAEPKLMQPTFVTAFPTEVSPLARKNEQDDFVTDRFELYAGGREIANGFSELNDPEDQAARFHAQLAEREAGDDEAMLFDEDYITALEYGMPPTAGEGIGIDRLLMLFADQESIRDVILFPLLRQK